MKKEKIFFGGGVQTTLKIRWHHQEQKNSFLEYVILTDDNM